MQVHPASVHTVKPTSLNVMFSLQNKGASTTASPDASLAECSGDPFHGLLSL